jgi:hypothetical protein
MQFNLDVNIDNDDYARDGLGYELTKAMQYIASDIGLGLTRGLVRDTNGNTTGKWEITE